MGGSVVISLIILAVQLFYIDNLSYLQGNLAIINSFIALILLFLYITLTADMYVSIKRIKEREKVEVPNEFRVDAFKQTYFINPFYITEKIFLFLFTYSNNIIYIRVIFKKWTCFFLNLPRLTPYEC